MNSAIIIIHQKIDLRRLFHDVLLDPKVHKLRPDTIVISPKSCPNISISFHGKYKVDLVNNSSPEGRTVGLIVERDLDVVAQILDLELPIELFWSLFDRPGDYSEFTLQTALCVDRIEYISG